MSTVVRVVSFFLFFSLVAAAAGTAHAAFTIEDEKKLGKEFYEKMEKSDALIKDPLIAAYIETVGGKVLAASPPSPFAFRFSVIRSSGINAFATPGGYVYVNRGLVTLVEDESQLASVIAHEIAHVQARHVAQMIEKATKLNIATLAAILAGAFLGGSGDLSAAVVGFSMAAATTMNLKYSRDHEEEADRMGMAYLQAAGYDRSAAVELLRIMRRYEFYSNAVPSYFLTHPGTDERIQYLDAMLHMKSASGGARKSGDTGNLKRIQTVLLVSSGDPEANVRRFQEDLQKHPGDVDSLYGLAMARERMGAAAEAQEFFRQALAKAPGDVRILRDLGISYFKSGRTNEAVTALARAYRLDQSDEETIRYLGRAYLATGQYDAALDLLRRAVAKHGDDADLYYNLATAYSKTQNPGESHYNFGLYFKQKKKPEPALFHFQEAAKYFPPDSERTKTIEKEIAALKDGNRPPPRDPSAPDGHKQRGSVP